MTENSQVKFLAFSNKAGEIPGLLRMCSSKSDASATKTLYTKYFRDDLTLVFEDAQCFNSISEPPSRREMKS